MRAPAVAVAVLAAACGRIGFAPADDGGAAGGEAGSGTDGGFVMHDVHYLKPSDTSGGEEFGAAVAVAGDGNTVAVGAVSRNGGRGAVYVFVRSGTTWVQQAIVTAANTQIADNFGVAVALSFDGNTLAVGAIGEDTAAIDSGAVYIFARDGGLWGQMQELKATAPLMGAQLGECVGLSADGSVVLAGAHFEANSTGAAYVFTRGAPGPMPYAQRARLVASNAEAGDSFGESCALAADGSRAAVGAYVEASASPGIDGDGTNNDLSGAGAVYVFAGGPNALAQEAYIKAPAPAQGDELGINVALSGAGDWLLGGASLDDGPGDAFTDSGTVYTLARDPQWEHVEALRAENADNDDLFGLRVAISADATTAVIGAIHEDGVNDATPDAGEAYVFTRSGRMWTQTTALRAPNATSDDSFGTPAVSADGRVIAIGAYQEDNDARGVDGTGTAGAAFDSGAVYVFE